MNDKKMCSGCSSKSLCPSFLNGGNYLVDNYPHKVLPCPFCGNHVSIERGNNEDCEGDGHYVYIECTNCYARSYSDHMLCHVIDAWNKRV